jgi:hypothetical protein
VRVNKQSTPNYEPAAVVWGRCVHQSVLPGRFSGHTISKAEALLREHLAAKGV